jgi:hemerythrin
MILWSDELSVGNQDLDAEHRQLIELINSLQKELGQEHTPLGTILEETLTGLMDYAKGHLKHEEQLMRSAAYPKYMEHKYKHDEFRKTTAEFLNRIGTSQDQDSQDTQARELLFFLQRWFISHIKGADREYAPYLS